MDAVVYNNEIVQRHPIYSCCKSTLNDVSNRDYPNTNYFNPDIECLDMDTFETQTRHGYQDKTVDAVIGVGAYSNNRFGNGRLLLVELRIGYKNADNLSKSELEGKVIHTKQLLSAQTKCDKNSIFIFSEKVAPQALRWMESHKHGGGLIKDFQVYSTKEFNQNVCSIESMPYTPIYNPNTIAQDLDIHILNSEYQELFKQVNYWKGQAINMRYSNIREFDNIRNVLLDKWKDFMLSCSTVALTDDDEIEVSIITEDLERVFNIHF